MQASHASFLQGVFVFHVDKTEPVEPSVTKVTFNDSHSIMRGICLKMWLKCHNDLYDTEDLAKQTRFLLDGLAFNRQFSGEICYGIVPVLQDSSDEIECGPLIEKPNLENLVLNRPYALVMKRLEEGWRLDQQLRSAKLGSTTGMEFLAHQVATMHERLAGSLPEFGTPERISGKLEFNIEQFHRALDRRRADPQIMAASVFGEADIMWIESASVFLRQFSEAHQHDFEKRHYEEHIKRCHGDLKASNLWICPPENASQAQERFIALDCVDFNPDFCNIDTLSDIAMLAVDLEMQLDNISVNRSEKLSGRQLARHFLQIYFETTGENETVWPLLEFYMTEKAMVCAYMSILYDKSPMLGEKYLKVVLAHSQELQNINLST